MPDGLKKDFNALPFWEPPVKLEGSFIKFDPAQTGDQTPQPADWMELRIPKAMSRSDVHKRVDEWLDDRDAGRT